MFRARRSSSAVAVALSAVWVSALLWCMGTASAQCDPTMLGISYTSYSTFCNTITVSWDQSQDCDFIAPGLKPSYVIKLTQRATGQVAGQQALPSGTLTYTFQNVALADYSVTGQVVCSNVAGAAVCSSNFDTIPGDPNVRPFPCCAANCDSPIHGDPHIRTLDGANVDYYLPGDYILLTLPGLITQSRMCLRAWGWSVNCGFGIKCVDQTFVVYTTMNSQNLITDLNGGNVNLNVGQTYTWGSAATPLSVKISAPDAANPWFRRTEVWCTPKAGASLYVMIELRTWNNMYWLDIYNKANWGIRGARGLQAGRYDNNTYNDVQYRNGVVYNFAAKVDPSVNYITPVGDPRINDVQRSWAVFGAEALFTRPDVGKENSDPSFWRPPARHNRHLLQEAISELDAKYTNVTNLRDEGLAACAPFIEGGGIPLENAAIDWAAAGGAMPCELIAKVYKKAVLAVGGMESLEKTATGYRRRLRQSDGLGKGAATICAAGGDIIRVKGKFAEKITSAMVGGTPTNVVKATKFRALVETQTFLNRAGIHDLKLGTDSGKSVTAWQAVRVKSAKITSVTPATAKPGDKVTIAGDFGNRGIAAVKFGRLPAKVLQASRKAIVVEVPAKVLGGKPTVSVETKACYGTASLSKAITITKA